MKIIHRNKVTNKDEIIQVPCKSIKINTRNQCLNYNPKFCMRKCRFYTPQDELCNLMCNF